ncbi:MAG: hypothetical protein JXM73_04000 [Anaerolineae bacterium]|nr:hypothetical protein [Anaerolineae bacterium]
MDTISDILSFMAGLPSLIGLILAAAIIFLAADWRLSLAALLVQYILVGMALSPSIQQEVVIVKILAGVLAVVILYLSARLVPPAPAVSAGGGETHLFLRLHVDWAAGPLGLPLRFLTVLLVGLAIVRLFQGYQPTLLPTDLALAACWLGGMGLLGLILSDDPLRVAPAALTILAGFDLAYAGLDQNLAVAGFCGVLTLLAALAFSYLILVPTPGSGQAGPGGREEPGT